MWYHPPHCWCTRPHNGRTIWCDPHWKQMKTEYSNQNLIAPQRCIQSTRHLLGYQWSQCRLQWLVADQFNAILESLPYEIVERPNKFFVGLNQRHNSRHNCEISIASAQVDQFAIFHLEISQWNAVTDVGETDVDESVPCKIKHWTICLYEDGIVQCLAACAHIPFFRPISCDEQNQIITPPPLNILFHFGHWSLRNECGLMLFSM